MTNPGESGKARSQVNGPGLRLARIMSEHRTTTSKDLRLNVAPETKGVKDHDSAAPSSALSHPAQAARPWQKAGGEVTELVGALWALTFFQLYSSYSFRCFCR